MLGGFSAVNLAGVMALIVGSSLGMDAAVAVLLSLAVMELDAQFS